MTVERRGGLGYRVVGVDPGSLCTGVGIVERDGARYRCLHAEVIRVAGEMPSRLAEIHARLGTVIDRFRPAGAAVEDVFHSRSTPSLVKLAQARGVVLLALAQAGLPVGSYPPAVVKRSVTGSGRADKPQVGRMVCAILGLADSLSPDAADAVAIALCHAMHLTLRADPPANRTTGATR